MKKKANPKSRKKSSAKATPRKVVVKKPPKSTIPLPAGIEDAWEEAKRREVSSTLQLETPEVGIFYDQPFEDYCQIQAINFSTLKLIATSLYHYRMRKQLDATPAIQLGSLVHEGRFEPALVHQKYFVVDEEKLIRIVKKENPKVKAPKQTSLYKQLLETEINTHRKKPIKPSEYEDMVGALRGIEANELSRDTLSRGFPEVTIVWRDPESGLYFKGRIDWLDTDRRRNVDLKSTADITRFKLDDYLYHWQAKLYSDGLFALTGHEYEPWIIAIETKHPYTSRAAPIDPAALATATGELAFLKQQLQAAIASNKWPGPSNPNSWELSEWYRPHKTFALHNEHPF